ncbi:long-chain-fatty-acid--CoA ligase ACSBG2-like isoform X3 [Haliotis rubra]|uniref:long-chain-fatty-acid--CoA ligase ACSBG2-like isoform X3 n=1 Tax=Haliotis rubra TaxID=36100 RepID=UPI001EE5BCE2|nr:long-chain-fatty-acid--CoA ligase ACSBG2-like isoform X3 [Haliotis rubra]
MSVAGISQSIQQVEVVKAKVNGELEINHNNSAVNIAEKPAEEMSVQTQSNGPEGSRDMDDVIHTQKLFAVGRSEPVRLRMSERGPGAVKPITVPTLLRQVAQKVPNNVALAVKRNGQWVKWTYSQYYATVCRTAKAFIKLGLEPCSGVGIIGFNSPEWFFADLGAIFAGGLATGIYTTNTPEACQFVASNAKINIIVAENNMQLEKFIKIKDQLPHLKAIIQYSGEIAHRESFVYSWEDFVKLGDDVPDSQLEDRLKDVAPNKCCTLIYTSGTTGNPKGVMLSHDNVTWTAKATGDANKLRFGEEISVSYLPLSHVAAQVLDIYLPISFGGTVNFAGPDALKGTLGQTLKEIRPTSFFGVPRVWEKMMERMLAIGKETTGLKKKISTWAKGVGLKGNYNLQNGFSKRGKSCKRAGLPFGFGIANALVFSKVRAALGFDRCRFFISGAAPITRDTLEYFLSLNIPIAEVYGMSESSGPHTFGRDGAENRIMSVGFEFGGIQTKLANIDSDGNGEICMFGRDVLMGYLENEEKTKETMDEEGWLHSGDIGKKDKDGFLFITGRIKEIIITAGGENIAPVPIEDVVKECIPAISNCMLIGDKKKFLALLITLKTEVDPDTLEPQVQLTAPAMEWCRAQGSTATTVSDILDRPDTAVLKAVQAGIDKANSRAVSRAAKIQKWSILPKDFSIPGGELGPTLKLRRPIVAKMYLKTIDAFYAEK